MIRDDILAFIKHFQNDGTIKTFTNGCCYWFACILQGRFYNCHATIQYNPVENHFATLIGNSLFDITGELESTCGWKEWEEYTKEEPSEATRIIKHCILKIN